MAIEVKKDLRVIVPYTVITLALFGALFAKVCTWPQFLAGLGLLNVPAFFGMKKGSDDDEDPPAQTPLFVDERKAETLPVPREPTPLPRLRPLVLAALLLAGCSSPTPAQKSTAADATYQADMLRCVDESTTKELETACRARVRAVWHVDGGSR